MRSNLIIIGAIAILLVACAKPITTIDNAPISASSPNYDLSDVTKAIKSAGVGLGWQMQEVTPGHIVGTLYKRSHMAKVDILYSLDDYSIHYKDSNNLDYDAAANTIHRNYNNWIQSLTHAINSQIVKL